MSEKIVLNISYSEFISLTATEFFKKMKTFFLSKKSYFVKALKQKNVTGTQKLELYFSYHKPVVFCAQSQTLSVSYELYFSDNSEVKPFLNGVTWINGGSWGAKTIIFSDQVKFSTIPDIDGDLPEIPKTDEQKKQEKLKKAQQQYKAFQKWLNSTGLKAKLELMALQDKTFAFSLDYGIDPKTNEFSYSIKTWKTDLETGQKVPNSEQDLNVYDQPDLDDDNSSEVSGTVKVEWGTPPKLEINPNPQLKLGVDTTELSNAKIPISNPDLLQLPVKFVEEPYKIGFDTSELENKKLIVDASDLENRKLGIDLTEKLKLDWSDIKPIDINIPENSRIDINPVTGTVDLNTTGKYLAVKTDGQSLAVRVDKDQKIGIDTENAKIDLGVPEVINHSIKMVDLDKLVTSLDNLNDTEFRDALKTMALQMTSVEYGENGIRKEEYKVAQNRNNVDYNNEIIIYNRSDGEEVTLKKGYKHNQMKKTEREIEQQYQQFSLNEVDIYAADNTKIGRNKVDVTDHLSGLGIKKPESREELKDYDIMLDVYEKYSDSTSSENEVDIYLQGKKS